jgi:hypothetical protein
MCFLFFHKWEKWSEPKDEIWKKWSVVRGVPISGTEREFRRLEQHRSCKRCGKFQTKYIKEYDSY